MKEHRYAGLARRLRTEIQSGVYLTGQQLPSEDGLTAMTGYSRQTVCQAVGVLEREDLTYRVQGNGTCVRSTSAHRQPTRNTTVVATYIEKYIFPAVPYGINHILVKNGYTPMPNATRNRVDNKRHILTELLQKPIDDVIMEGAKTALPNPNIDLYERSAEMGIPVVFIGGFYPNLKRPIYVTADDRAGGLAACMVLMEKGHRRIAGIFKSDNIQGHRRYAGYVEALYYAGPSVEGDHVMWCTTESRGSLFDICTPSVLSTYTGAVCCNNEVTLRILEVLGKTGVAIPQQMELVSFDHDTLVRLSPTPFLSLSNPKETPGRPATEKLLHTLGGRAEQSVLLPRDIEQAAFFVDFSKIASTFSGIFSLVFFSRGSL